MQTEFEIKVLDIDVPAVTRSLAERGYRTSSVQNFRRYVFESPLNADIWIRLRTDGAVTTLAIKQYVSDTIDGVRETETTVGSFERTREALIAMGMRQQNYQENTRTNFSHASGGLAVSIDTWPHIPPYMEIEGPDHDSVKSFLADLSLHNATTSAPTSEVYKKYGIDLNTKPVLKFDAPIE